MKEETICIEITDPVKKTKKHFKSKKKVDGNVVLSAVSENEFTTVVAEEAFGLSNSGISKRLQKEIQDTVDETYKSFKNGMKDAVLGALGFDRDFRSGWRVDHCNGRMSAVTEHISHLAKDFFKEVKIKDLADTLTDEDKKGIHSAIVKEVKGAVVHMVQDRLKSQIYETITASIQDIVKNTVEKEIAQHRQMIKDTVKEQLDNVVSNEDFEKSTSKRRC